MAAGPYRLSLKAVFASRLLFLFWRSCAISRSRMSVSTCRLTVDFILFLLLFCSAFFYLGLLGGTWRDKVQNRSKQKKAEENRRRNRRFAAGTRRRLPVASTATPRAQSVCRAATAFARGRAALPACRANSSCSGCRRSSRGRTAPVPDRRRRNIRPRFCCDWPAAA